MTSSIERNGSGGWKSVPKVLKILLRVLLVVDLLGANYIMLKVYVIYAAPMWLKHLTHGIFG